MLSKEEIGKLKAWAETYVSAGPIPYEIAEDDVENAKRVLALIDRNEALEAIVREHTKFITGLTPGGSEYFRRLGDDLFYADLETCRPAVEHRMEFLRRHGERLAALPSKED